MDVFELRQGLIDTYREYATSFMRIRDQRIRTCVDDALDSGKLWPHPGVGLNPAFASGGTIKDLVEEGVLHPGARPIFRLGKSEMDTVGSRLSLWRHQAEAIRVASDDRNYVLTTGTGSGKSLAYIIPIVDHVLRTGSGTGVKAIVVYPMNALANSQMEELSKFLDFGPWVDRPVTFQRYTGQDDQETRDRIQSHPPDILLTNYVMLELILTRYRDRRLVRGLGSLRYLVLDELHSYRGRQGADVALLARRLREASGSEVLRCVGTSATLSTEGTYEERRQHLAQVGSRLFGAEVRPDDVIGETLERVTPDRDTSEPEYRRALARMVKAARPPDTYEGLVTDPLSSWIETTFGVGFEEGRLVRAVPAPIKGPKGAATELADLTGVDEEACERALRAYLLAGHQVQNPRTGTSAFAFRLHQFISRGDTVYASPEPANSRYLTLAGQRFVPGDRGRSLLPLAFCRACGQDYYVVHRQSQSPAIKAGRAGRFTPRDLGDTQDDEASPGFLYLSDDHPWPNDAIEIHERLPQDWFDGEGRLRHHRRDQVPRPVEVFPDGSLASDAGEEGAVAGWWTPAKFRFCLACGVSYAGRIGRDFTRLTTLGSEGRSTATTIMSLAAVRRLREDDRLPSHARKLLSFTDNRQDASLQAGHFNDFVRVTLLRSALWRALAGSPSGIRHDELAQKVFEALSLPRQSYALDPDLRGLAGIDTDRALRGVLEYRLYRDLQRGWRLTQPDLEQAGLLVIEYESLADLAADDDMWSDCHPSLSGCDPARREFVLTVLLDWIRRELGIKVYVLDSRQQESLKRRAEQRLIGSWSLEHERLEYATEVLTRPGLRWDSREWRYVSARGGFGQFVRRQNALGGVAPGRKLTLVDTTELIKQMFERLRRYGLLLAVGKDRDGHERWQIPAAALIWKAGDGTAPYQDHIRMPNAPDVLPTNRYFVDLYRSVSTALVDMEAREHTAQVSYDQRLEREERFRSADLPVMFCSPTMELGVDISELNVVNMRNVPPTPANYAQRSGRAGRSGQPALVFTYCAAGNSHDQHFFREPERMIAGQVEAPRVDLTNEDLIRAHVHSVWLSETGLNLGQSMGDILDLVDGVARPELTAQVRDTLHDPNARANARSRAQVVLDDLDTDLREAPWWSDNWLDDVLRALPRRFEDALERWRTLYAAALTQAREQNRIATSPTRSARDQRQARRLRREAENQLGILRATSDHSGQSDFYTYRYFASEGFLPGYSFPRLPLSAFLPGRRGRYDRPEFLQRPRFLAISEFGPQTYIYHEGARYRINRVILSSEVEAGAGQETDGPSLVTQRAKRCEHCGYMHRIDSPPGPDVCSYCAEELGATWTNLLRMRHVSTVRHDRITSDEEERRRLGYEVMSAVRFAEREGRPSVARADVVAPSNDSDSEPLPLLHLSYGDATTIWRINLGWRNRRAREQRGFMLDVERGYWGKRQDSEDPEDPMSPRTERVIPYVTDTRNALLIQPRDPLDAETMASLEAALKAAMEVVFQLESSELATEPLPSRDDRRMLLFYESAEGGAGALRRLIDEPSKWRRIARKALRRCHVDPDTGAPIPGEGAEPCGGACYDCLLTYRNQLDHGLLDRATVIPILTRLRDSEISRSQDRGRLRVDSTLEEAFLAHLQEGGYRLPDRSQVYFREAGTRPDFVYDDACAVVYIDGPHHDYPERCTRDRNADRAMLDFGYRVIRLGHKDDWNGIISGHPSVFGAGRMRESRS